MGQKESPQTIHLGPYHDLRGIPTNTNSMNDLMRSWYEYMSKVNNERTGNLKPKTKVHHMYQEKSNDYFSLGDPVFFETRYYDGIQGYTFYPNGPFQIIEFHESEVELRDLSRPYPNCNQFVPIEKLLKVKSPVSGDGIALSEFEIQLIQKNSVPYQWLLK